MVRDKVYKEFNVGDEVYTEKVTWKAISPNKPYIVLACCIDGCCNDCCIDDCCIDGCCIEGCCIDGCCINGCCINGCCIDGCKVNFNIYLD